MSEKRTVEECDVLDVSNVTRSGSSGLILWGPPGLLTSSGRLGIVTIVVRWRRQDHPDSSAAFKVNLVTTSTTWGNPTPWEQNVSLVSRPCSGRLKGSCDPALRYYYLFPWCRTRRCSRLYLPRTCMARAWACRTCWELAYASQNPRRSTSRPAATTK